MTEFSSAQKDFLEALIGKLNVKIDEQAAKIKLEIDEVKEKVSLSYKTLETQIITLEEQNSHLRKSVTNLERKLRKNNVAIFGIHTKQDTLINCVCSLFQDQLGIQINEDDLNNVYRTTSQGNNNKNPVIVEFISYTKKQHVLKNAKKLKGLNIYITSDLCLEDQNKQRVLVKHLKQARKKGVGAYIKGNKLFVANEPFTAEQLEHKHPLNGDEEDRNITEKETLEITNKQKSDSAPPTPTSSAGNKRQIKELEVREEKTQKKPKADSKDKIKNYHGSIKTRSNSVTNN